MVKKHERKNNLNFNNKNMNWIKSELLLKAKNKIENIINISWNIISSSNLVNIKTLIETWNTDDLIVKIREYLKQYWNIIIKSDIWKALYELIDIFKEIDKDYEKEDKE